MGLCHKRERTNKGKIMNIICIISIYTFLGFSLGRLRSRKLMLYNKRSWDRWGILYIKTSKDLVNICWLIQEHETVCKSWEIKIFSMNLSSLRLVISKSLLSVVLNGIMNFDCHIVDIHENKKNNSPFLLFMYKQSLENVQMKLSFVNNNL